jgi:hypothetical protein
MTTPEGGGFNDYNKRDCKKNVPVLKQPGHSNTKKKD